MSLRSRAARDRIAKGVAVRPARRGAHASRSGRGPTRLVPCRPAPAGGVRRALGNPRPRRPSTLGARDPRAWVVSQGRLFRPRRAPSSTPAGPGKDAGVDRGARGEPAGRRPQDRRAHRRQARRRTDEEPRRWPECAPGRRRKWRRARLRPFPPPRTPRSRTLARAEGPESRPTPLHPWAAPWI